jgi:hypothetical protein
LCGWRRLISRVAQRADPDDGTEPDEGNCGSGDSQKGAT